MPYGVLPTGFNRKPLAVILQEIEQDIHLIPQLATLDLSPSTPDGQIMGQIGLYLDELWSIAEGVYNSNKITAATGSTLDRVMLLERGLTRLAGETDAEFIRRALIVSNGGTLVDQLYTRLAAVPGIVRYTVLSNSQKIPDQYGMPASSWTVVAIGGSDQDVANAIHQYNPGGIGTMGNTSVSVTNSSGLCEVVNFTRPVKLTGAISMFVSAGGRAGTACSSPTKAGVIAWLTASGRLVNGVIDFSYGQSVNKFNIASMFPQESGIQLLDAFISANGTTTSDCSTSANWWEYLSVAEEDISVVVV